MSPWLRWVRDGRRRWFMIAVLALVVPPIALVVAAALTPLPPELIAPPPRGSIRVLDRHGHLMRDVRADDGAHARWVGLDELGPHFTAAMIAAEDRRFYSHHGVDPFAVVRAAATSLRHLRIVSGASTLTMQLARTLRPHPRTLLGKLGEMALAMRIDASLSKAQILEQYVNRVDFGPRLRGVAATSEALFDKPPRALSLGESALLAGLPRGPSFYALDKNPSRGKTRRSTVLARMMAMGAITESERSAADAEPIATFRAHASQLAPHFVDGLISGRIRALSPELVAAWDARVTSVTTTIDASLQRQVEAASRTMVESMRDRHVTAASVVVIDNATGDLLAWVGSPDVTDDAHLGINDGVLGLRQPGSALKPFLYAQAIDSLGFTPATILPDIELHLPIASGTWTPRNYDEHFHGPIRLREALGSSLNVPAAWTAAQLGVEPFLEHLRALGFDDLRGSASTYGPGLALGDGEVRLLALTNAYRSLARGGVASSVQIAHALERVGGGHIALESVANHRVMSATAAALVTDVLQDRRARLRSFGDFTPLDFAFDVAVKTGTSKGFRDNWTVGFSSEITVGVWVGNFDGSPMQEISGISGAGPLFQDVMEAAMRGRAAHRLALGASVKSPSVAITNDDGSENRLVAIDVCALSGERAGDHCTERVREWMPETAAESLGSCTRHVAVRVDRRNGKQAGPACASADTDVRVFERVTPEFLSWALAEKRPLVPSESSPFCPVADAIGPVIGVAGDAVVLAIRRPLDDVHLVIDPETPRASQQIEIDVVAPADVQSVALVVDGVVGAAQKSPFVFSWPLAVGDHAIAARDDHGITSRAIALHVR